MGFHLQDNLSGTCNYWAEWVYNSCVLKVSMVKGWLKPLVKQRSTLNEHIDQCSVDTWSKSWLILDWHRDVDWVSMKCQWRCWKVSIKDWSSVNQVYSSSVNHGYWSTLNHHKGIDPHSTVNVFRTHDPNASHLRPHLWSTCVWSKSPYGYNS